MKKRFVLPIALALVVAMFAVGCGNNGGNTPEPAPAPVASSEAESAAPEVKVPATILNGPEVIEYTNVNYDFSADISRELDLVKTSPDASPALLSVSDNQGTSGMVLVPSVEAGNTMDIYMNALVAGNEVTIKGDIKTAESSVQGALEAVEGGVKFVPAPLKAMEANDEVINVVLNDGTVYNIHTWNQHLPNFDINVQNVAEENKGVYHFTIDKVAL
ncbi:MAG: hypothetical protein HUJ75_04620, partial [Parasporobacterium sp.]|nr:hypothetical protein [Parasporobacterium sp.]